MRNAPKRLILQKGQCLVLQPAIAKQLGKSGALFLQQLHYWLSCEKEIGTTTEGKRWIYNSAKEWACQLCLSERQISRIINHLKEVGILLVDRLSQRKSDRTNWYSINYQALEHLLPGLAWHTEETTAVSKSHSSYTIPDKMSGSFRHNVGMYNKETEITSETKPLSTEGRGEVRELLKTQQVHFVEKESLSINKNLGNKNTLASDLMEIWNQTVGKEQGQGGSLVQLTKKRAQHLVAAFKYRFESNQLKWKQFCQQVTSSDFLMGKVKSTFKASLDWVLKFDVIQRILEGDFGVKEKILGQEENPPLDAQTLSNHIETRDDSETVKQFRKSILKTFGEQTYQSWFADMPIREEGRGVVLTAKSQFLSDYIQTHYLTKLKPLTSRVINIFVDKTVDKMISNEGFKG